jgi:hypothetical protein
MNLYEISSNRGHIKRVAEPVDNTMTSKCVQKILTGQPVHPEVVG